MIVIHRRLFWKIYLTMLLSLVAVAVLMGGFWWLMGESTRERWGAYHIHLPDHIVLDSDNLPDAATDAVRLLGDNIGAALWFYAQGGGLIAMRGEPITLAANDSERMRGGPPRILRVDFPDGRIVLVRLRPAPPAG